MAGQPGPWRGKGEVGSNSEDILETPWRRPGTASRVVGLITDIAKKAVNDKVSYRMAKVVQITEGAMTIVFADEPDNEVVIENLPMLRPKNAGGNVEIEVRNGTEFLLNRVFGESVLLDASQMDRQEPPAPTGFVVTSAARTVTARWEPAERARTYDVQSAKDANFTTEDIIYHTTSNQLVLTGLRGGDGLFFRVRGVNTAGEGDWSDVVGVTVDQQGGYSFPPAIPTPLEVLAGDRSHVLTWPAGVDAERYTVQFSKTEDFSEAVGTQVVQTNQWVRQDLVINDTWYYRVQATNSAGSSPFSPTVSATVVSERDAPAAKPARVSGVAHSSSNRAVTTVWNPQSVADYFDMERSKTPEFAFGTTTTMRVQGNTITLQDLIAGEKWYYRIRGVNDAGAGDWSETTDVTVQTDLVQPGAPDKVLNLKLSSIPGQIDAKWDSLDGAEKYEVQRALDSLFNGGFTSEIVETNATTATDLAGGETWHFRVRGISADLPGPWSDLANIMVMLVSDYTDGSPPEDSPPTSVRPGLFQLIATWPVQVNGDPVTYEVHIGTESGFLPSPTTKLGETSGTFWIVNYLPDGTKLQAGTTYFMRVVAKDADGAANPGAQGLGIPDKIDLGDVGDVQYKDLQGDGLVPPTPGTMELNSGIGYLYGRWANVGNVDPVTYEVHVSPNQTFIPDSNSLSLVTTSLFAFIRRQGPGANNAPLAYGVTYYVRLVARDVDGVSQPGPPVGGFTIKANTPDIAVGAITAGSAIIGEAAIGFAHIADGNITNAKIGDLQVSSGKIANLAVTNAKINDLAVTSAKIQDLAVTTAKISDLSVTSAKIQNVQASKITTDQLTAVLTVSGAIRTSTANRRVEINSGGLFMYDDFGGAIVQLNAAVGSAFFRGNIYAVDGTFTGNITSSATITGGTFDGGKFLSSRSTASVRNYIEMGNTGISDPVDEIRFWTGQNVGSIRNPSGTAAGQLRFSMTRGGVGQAIMTMDPVTGFNTGGKELRAQGIYDNNARVYSVHNPPPAPPANQDLSFDYLNSGPLYIRGANDNNHRLQYGVAGRDGPDLRGYNHVGLGVVTWSATGWAFRIDGSGNAFLAGGLTSNQSKRAIKRDIEPVEGSLAGVLALQPIKYKRNDFPVGHPAEETEYLGFVAEDVESLFPQLVSYDDQDGSIFGLSYAGFVVPLTSAVQELARRLDELERRTPVRP